jgi:hypothetical protein
MVLSHRLHVRASRLHKWLALILSAQLLIWFLSGAIFAWLPIERVRGEHLVDRARAGAIPAGQRLAPVETLLARAGGATAITWRMAAGRPVAEVETAAGPRLFDAATATPLALGPRDAVAIARAAWIGPPTGAPTVERVTAASTDYRGRLPAWRVRFPDNEQTRVYVTDTGRIAAVRTGTWALYDFLWGLHIMDWKNHEAFNTPWLLGFAVASLGFWTAGLVLLVKRWPLRRRGRVRSSPLPGGERSSQA